MSNEERFERIVKIKDHKLHISNLIFNSIFTILFFTMFLIFDNGLFKALSIFMIVADLIYLLLIFLDREIYWRKIK